MCPPSFRIFAVMKYRMLTSEEMEIFDEDFKHFCVANGVSNEAWIEMNQSKQEVAKQLVELFSDTVLQKVYEKVRFIEHRSRQACLVFHLQKGSIELISINATNDAVDLSTPESIHQSLKNYAGQLSMFQSTKSYTKEREIEIHEMLEQGCVNSSEAFWMLLKKVVS